MTVILKKLVMTFCRLWLSNFLSDYCRWAKKKGYHANEAKAKAIYAMAHDGIPTLSSSSTSTKMLVLEAARVLREVNKTLKSILAQMQEIAKSLPEYKIVRAMSGVGDVLAPGLIAEIGDTAAFIVVVHKLLMLELTLHLLSQEHLWERSDEYLSEALHCCAK